MKRKITFLLVAMLLMSGLTWAQTDVLDHDAIGVSGNSYSNWSDLTLTSGAVYAGNTAGGNNAIQMRSSNNNSGIVTTTSAGVVTNITVAWNSNTAAGRTLNVYGSNSAYDAASDLYGNTSGTLIGTIAKGTTELEITDEYAFIGIRSASGALYLDEIQITWSEGSGVTPPSITANNVEIAYDIDGDEIEYLINNPVDGGVLTAATESDWLTLGEVGETIPFTCTINQAATARTATVTLTYTYNRATVTKNVTVTQTGNPNIIDNISDITAAGSYTVQGTIVAKSQRGFIVGDGTGYVYYYNQNYTQADYNIGDVVKLSGSVVVYGGVYEFNNSATITAATESNYQAEDPTVLTGADMDARVASTTPPQLSNYVQYEGTLTVSGTHYNITNITGATTAIGSISYPLDTEFASLNGKHVKVSGYYVGISSSTYYNTIIGSVEEVVSTEPSITVTPATVNLDAEQHYMNLLDLAYENIEVEGPSSFTVHYYNAEGDEIELVQGEAWLVAGVVMQDDVYQVLFAVVANYGEARTAYFKVSCGETYSNLVTVTQAAPVLDYAVLPFVWEGGSSADFAALNGVTLSGNGSDYNSNHAPYLIKLDGTGDYIQVKTDSQPGKVTIGVKMVGGSNTSTITIQGSADGVTFTDIEELTISGAQNDILTLETTNVFDANDRYVRMLFTKGSNVGVGPITIASGSAPSIIITPATLDLEAVGTMPNGMQMQQLNVTYHNLDITQASDFTVQFYDAEGEEQAQPVWITPNTVVSGGNDLGYIVMLIIDVNDGPARSAYFKAYALDAEGNTVYSNLATINQAGAQYTLTVEPFENLEIFTFVGGDESEMALEGAGTIQVAEGDNVMLSITANEGYEIQSLMVDGVEHVNDIDEAETYTFFMPDHNVTVSATAVAVVPFEPATYTLATSIESGKTYIIVGNKTINEETTYYAMGEQRNNNRGGVAINADGTTATVTSADVYEFVITALEDGFYSIYDDRTPGYLYAAASGSNYLRTEPELDTLHNGDWEITFNEEGYAEVVASNSSNRSVMQFNSNNTLFSCYSSASQSPVYFYVKDETPSTLTQTIALTAGTNWFSTYVDITLADLQTALTDVLGTGSNVSITIKSQTRNSKLTRGRWTGTLTAEYFDLGNMYTITVNSDCEITLEGMPVNPADHPVTILGNGNTNWIAFPISETMTPTDAFAGFAVNGDALKSKLQNATYTRGRWNGALQMLVPGQGYIYKSATNAADRTFTYPTSK